MTTSFFSSPDTNFSFLCREPLAAKHVFFRKKEAHCPELLSLPGLTSLSTRALERES